MPFVYLVGGSPSFTSRSSQLLEVARRGLEQREITTDLINLRTLPAEDLVTGKTDTGPVSKTVKQLEAASGLVLATPVYKASLSGLTKLWLDLLPQFALRGKVVLPLATGASLTSVLAVDYGMRPVLNSMGTLHVLPGCFVLESWLHASQSGEVTLDEKPQKMLDELIDAFVAALA